MSPALRWWVCRQDFFNAGYWRSLLGSPGLILATPLIVCAIVAVLMLSIEEFPGDSVKMLGKAHFHSH